MAKHGNLTYVTRIDPATEKQVSADGLRKVFVSYKKSDNVISGIRDIVVRKILRMVNCAVWYDEYLTPGVNYEQEIIDAISECDAVVLLLTRDILQSTFVWDIEVATAREQKKGIIPIAFGISAEDFAEAERRLGDKLQIMCWPSESDKGMISEDSMKFDDAFERALNRFVIDADLAMRVEQFFASDRHKKPVKDLDDDQKYLMAYGYFKGLGIEQDIDKGIGLMDYITRLYGDDKETLELKAKAALELDEYYYELEDFKRSVEYRRIGAGAGSAEAIKRLGFAYDEGKGVEQNYAKAIELYTKASEMGHAGATNNLGVMYKNGEGVEIDLPKAIGLYEKASAMGSIRATHNLGWMYYHGLGVEKDLKKAFGLYTKASDVGDARATYDLGVMYYNGEGVEQDKEKAVELYAKAAEMGNANATCSLGVMYDKGDGVEQDKAKAVELFTKAAEMGLEAAKIALEEIKEAEEATTEAAEETPAEEPKKLTPREARAAKKAEKAAAKKAAKEAKVAAKAAAKEAKRAARKK